MQTVAVVAGVLVVLCSLLTLYSGARNSAKRSATSSVATAQVENITKISALQSELRQASRQPANVGVTLDKFVRETTATLRPDASVAADVIRYTGTGTLQGTVMEGDTTPIAGATVALLSSESLLNEEPFAIRTTKSDANGSFTLERLNMDAFTPRSFGEESGQPMLLASKDGYVPSVSGIRRGLPSEIRLSRNDKQQFTIVIDAATKEPLSGVRITWYPTYPQQRFITAEDGKFPKLFSQHYTMRVVAEKEGYYQTGSSIYPGAGDVEHLMMARGGATVKGSVVDTDGEPVTGITTLTDSFRTIGRTDATGNFTITNLAQKPLTLCAVRNGEMAKTIVDLTDADKDGVLIRLQRILAVTGTLRDEKDKITPLANVQLSAVLNKKHHTVTTNADGQFSMNVSLYGGQQNNFVKVINGQMPTQGEQPLNFRIRLETDGMLFWNEGATEMSQHTSQVMVEVEPGTTTKHVELFATAGVPVIKGQIGMSSRTYDYPMGFQVAYHTDSGTKTAMGSNNSDGTYTVRLDPEAKLTRAFLFVQELNYTQLIELTGAETIHDIPPQPSTGADIVFTTHFPCTIELSDGTPILETFEDSYVTTVFHAEPGLDLESVGRGMAVRHNIPRLMMFISNWPNTSARLSLPDGTTAVVPVSKSAAMGKLIKFVYNPVPKAVDVQYVDEPTAPAPEEPFSFFTVKEVPRPTPAAPLPPASP